MLFILFSLPVFQTFVGKKVTNAINEKYKTNIKIDKVDLSYFGNVALKDVFVRDHHNDSLIFIRSFETSILDYQDLYNGKLLFGDVDLDGLTLIIKTYKGEKDSSLDVFIDKLDASDTLPRKPSSFLLSTNKLTVTNSKFKYIDENLSTPEILNLKELNTVARDFEIKGPNVSASVNDLSFYDSRGVRVNKLDTDFSYSLTQMRFDDLKITTDQSNLKGDIVFDYDRKDFKDFNNKVNITANFENANIALDEINKFYNEFGKGQQIVFSTKVSGTLNDFTTENLKLHNKRRTRIDGTVRFKNLFTKSNDFYISGNYKKLSSNNYDLKAFLPNILGDVFPSSFEELGNFNIVGTTTVTNKKVTTDVTIYTAIGDAEAELEITNIDNIDNADYHGSIYFDDFDLGAFINDANFGKLTGYLDVDGKGFTNENLNTEVKGKLSRFGFNKYDYEGVTVNGKIKDQLFEGKLLVKDENLDLDFNGLANFAVKNNKYNFIADIKKANLKALHLFERDSISQLSGKIIMNFQGSTIDDAYGTFEFKDTQYINPNKAYFFEDFKISSSFDPDRTRHISIDATGVISGKIHGKFKFADIGKLVSNSAGSLYTNYEPIKVKEGQYLDFNFKVYNQLVEIFYPNIKIGKNTLLRGKVGSDEKDFKVTFKTPLVEIDDNKINNVNLQIDNKNPLFNTFVKVDEIRTKYYDVDNFKLINKTLNDTLFFKTEFEGGKNKNDKFDLNLYHTINTENKSVVGFKKSKMNFNSYEWFINEANSRKNRVVFDNNFQNVKIEDFLITQEDQLIQLFGELEGTSEKDITLNLEAVDLHKLLPEMDNFSVEGLVNGNVHVFQQNNQYTPKGTLLIDDFKVNDIVLGQFNLDVTGDDALSNYQINGFIVNENVRSFTTQGNIDFSAKQPKINIDTYFDDFNLGILNVFGEDVLTDIRGFVTGGANLVGNIDNPDIIGILYLKDAGMKIPYLNIDFDFENNASVSLSGQQFLFNNIAILDTKYLTSGRLNGFIEHESFSDWKLDLTVNTNNLLVLDTELKDDSLYYGTAFISGQAHMYGPTEALVIDVVAQTQPNTTFKIPIRDSESIGDNSYIRFITKEEKLAEKLGQEVTFEEVEGLELNFDLDVTRDAEIEIVIDQKTGSTLRGRGAGNLLVEINTSGKFNMYGDFITYEGTYNFIYGGLIEKRFKVLPGGTINWEGDPFAAQLNINAVYSTEANPAILLDNSTVNRKIPVDVVINLTNQLLQPDVDFQIEFPKTSSVIKSELQYKLQDKENRELQALSLVTSGTFVNRLGVGDGAVVGNLTERAESLLEDIFADDDAKFVLGVDFEQGERTPDSDIRTDDRLGVTLSTQISDRVLINGKVGVPVGGVNETVIIGDVEIEFLLNDEGTLRAKVFNRENDFQALGLGEEIGYTQGVGLSYQVDFDSFKELIQKIFKKSKEEKPIAPPVQDNDIPDYIRFKEDKDE